MPAVLISTLDKNGRTTCGPYSLVQPFYIAGKDYYAMMLCCRNSSNTAQNLIRTKKCVLNFLPAAIKGCIKWAKENNVTVLDEAEMIIINDKRSKEKKK